jgi:hypothetical protein
MAGAKASPHPTDLEGSEMPQRDLRSVWTLLADLYRELSVLFRVCFFTGLAAGLALGLYLISGIPRSEMRFGLFRGVQWFLFGLTVVGGLLGLGLATVIELVWHGRGGPQDKSKRRKR